jgi:hypothetical protein
MLQCNYVLVLSPPHPHSPAALSPKENFLVRALFCIAYISAVLPSTLWYFPQLQKFCWMPRISDSVRRAVMTRKCSCVRRLMTKHRITSVI